MRDPMNPKAENDGQKLAWRIIMEAWPDGDAPIDKFGQDVLVERLMVRLGNEIERLRAEVQKYKDNDPPWQ